VEASLNWGLPIWVANRFCADWDPHNSARQAPCDSNCVLPGLRRSIPPRRDCAGGGGDRNRQQRGDAFVRAPALAATHFGVAERFFKPLSDR